MPSTCRILLILPFLAGLMLFAGSQAQAQAQAQRVYVVPAEPAPVHVRTFVITDTGKHYYVDSKGGLHEVVRQTVESQGGGGLYYIEDDDRPYYLDQSGELYYRDSSGRVRYIEEVNPGRAMQPGMIIREEAPQTYVAVTPGPPMPRQSCASQYQECMDGCQGISPRQQSDKPNCMSICDQIKSTCRDY